jgi:hypothetical protein
MFNVLVLLIMSVTVMLATYVLYNERQLNNVSKHVIWVISHVVPEPENAFNMRNESDEDDMSWQSFTPFFVMWPKEYIHGLFSPFRISKGCKQMWRTKHHIVQRITFIIKTYLIYAWVRSGVKFSILYVRIFLLHFGPELYKYIFSPWYSWKIAELTLNNNNRLTHCITIVDNWSFNCRCQMGEMLIFYWYIFV